LSDAMCYMLLRNFIETSWPCMKKLVESLQSFKQLRSKKCLPFFRFERGRRTNLTYHTGSFFLRGSLEYSNPQLTLEETQGIVGIRLLETCGNYFNYYGLNEPNAKDFVQLCEALKKPSEGPIVAFLLNTDDIEADRYSMNPMRESIVESGQSAFPVAYVKTDSLEVDHKFVNKYRETLVSSSDIEFLCEALQTSNGSYMDLIDSMKFAQLAKYSDVFGINLTLPAMRMPLETLRLEEKEDLLHFLVSETHKDYDAISQAYSCMGRSMAKKTTLLTVPHSEKGYGSKRAVRGKLHFDGARLQNVAVTYKTTRLYPNGLDPHDVSIARAEDKFTVQGEKLVDYMFRETPSSPQFFLYSLGSPENAVVWHGIGAYAAPKLLQSYISFHNACRREQIIKNLTDRYGIETEVPTHFNLTPESMWVHPKHRNIDASIDTVENHSELIRFGMKIETL
jgi:hypothetical protein